MGPRINNSERDQPAIIFLPINIIPIIINLSDYQSVYCLSRQFLWFKFVPKRLASKHRKKYADRGISRINKLPLCIEIDAIFQ